MGRPRKEIEGYREPDLIKGSNALPNTIASFGFVPRGLKSNSALSDNEQETCVVGTHLVTYEDFYRFDSAFRILKGLLESHPHKRLFLIGSNQTVTYAGQPLILPTISVLIAPNGIEPPTLLEDCKSGHLQTFEDRDYEWSPLKKLRPPDYAGRRKGTSHPLELLDDFLENRVFALRFVGRQKNRYDDESKFVNLRLLDCRSGNKGKLPAKYFNPDGTMNRLKAVKEADFFFVCDGKRYDAKYIAQTKSDCVDELMEDNEELQDNEETNRSIIFDALEKAIKEKTDSINGAFLELETYDRNSVDEIKLALIGPSNVNEVVIEGAKQQVSKEYYWTCFAKGKPLSQALGADNVFDLYISDVSGQALSCFSDELAHYGTEFIFNNGASGLKIMADGSVDVGGTKSQSQTEAQNYLKTLHPGKETFTKGEKIALEIFSELFASKQDPSTTEITIELLQQRLRKSLDAFDETVLQFKFSTSGPYGKAISIDGVEIGIDGDEIVSGSSDSNGNKGGEDNSGEVFGNVSFPVFVSNPVSW